jgi:hypothetical protein
VSYRPLHDPGGILAEIGAFHRAFAYHAGTEDPADHVAVAADFVAYLALKEAFARGAAREPDAATARAAREQFVAQHVRPVVHGMARRLFRAEPGVDRAHFGRALSLLSRLAGSDAEPRDAGADASDSPMAPQTLDPGSFGCAAVGCCSLSRDGEPPTRQDRAGSTGARREP